MAAIATLASAADNKCHWNVPDSAAISCGGIEIVSPKEGQVVIAGQHIKVIARVEPGYFFSKGLDLTVAHDSEFTGRDMPLFNVPVGPGEYTLTLVAPEIMTPGARYLIVDGYNSDEDYHMSKRNFRIELPDSVHGKLATRRRSLPYNGPVKSVDDLRRSLYSFGVSPSDGHSGPAEPEAIRIGSYHKRFHARIHFYLNMDDGKSIEITESSRLHLGFEDSTIARIAASTMTENSYEGLPPRQVGPGVIEQLAPGKTYLNVTYGEQHLRIPVIVEKDAIE